MAKLYFRYGAMGSSKTANVLMVRYNYEERGQYAVLLKPKTDSRSPERFLQSRIGLTAEGLFVDEFIRAVKESWTEDKYGRLSIRLEDGRKIEEDIAAVLVDEAQFLTEEEVDFFSDIVDKYHIPVLCYGLRTDFQQKFFPGSRRLMEIADVIEEVPTVCWCGKRAKCNARFANGKIVRTGEQIMLGANESYIALCREHYKEGKLSAD